MSIRLSAFVAAALAFLALGAPLTAHEGHDHDAGAVAIPLESAAPRLEASSSAFELVAIRLNGALTIWLDRFATNEPVTDAVIEVETPAGPQTATPTPDGAFTLPAPWAQKPGRYDLIFTVTAGGDVDVLTGALETPKPEAAAPAATARPRDLSYAVLSGLSSPLACGVDRSSGRPRWAFWRWRPLAPCASSPMRDMTTSPKPLL